MRGSERSLLRQALVLLLAFCLGAAVAPAVAQGEPAPDPAPPRAQTPKPEPVTGARSQPSRPVTTHVSPRQATPARGARRQRATASSIGATARTQATGTQAGAEARDDQREASPRTDGESRR